MGDRENEARSVSGFAFGADLAFVATLFTLIAFTRDIIEKASLADYTPLVPLISVNTSHLARDGKFFV